jgi:acyl-CoA synthetase (AMP-forming)/AMP-acid ligase II
MSFSSLEAEARLIARGLLALGLERGERVALWATNVPEWIILQFALAKVGEEVAAAVRLKSNATASTDELRAFCRGKIAHFKIPKYFRFVVEFPMTASGKIQKYKLREVHQEELQTRS